MKKANQQRSRKKASRARHEAKVRAQRVGGVHQTHPAMGHAGRVTGRRAALISNLLDGGLGVSRSSLRWVSDKPRAWVRALPIDPQDRQIAVLLLAPLFILAVAIAANQGLQWSRQLTALIARPVPPDTLVQTRGPTAETAIAPLPGAAVSEPRSSDTIVTHFALAPDNTVVARPMPLRPAYVRRQPDEAMRMADVTAPALASVSQKLVAISNAPPPRSIGDTAAGVIAPRLSPDTALAAALERPDNAPPVVSAVQLALLGPVGLPSIATYDEQHLAARDRPGLFERCSIDDMVRWHETANLPYAASASIPVAAGETGSFGKRLAEVARRQLSSFVVYDDAYRSIAYPRGDVPALYGVCTDVVIRAYREVGIDLQVAVQQARVGSGDRSIDHRRTETLRRFFARVGETLPVTTFAEDYRPGDIVTYARPQNTGTSSRSHIAIVSDVLASSGRPMILHNRGWGPQLEDALFVDQITGHYRYAAAADAPVVIRQLEAVQQAQPRPARRSHKRAAVGMTPVATRRAIARAARTAANARTVVSAAADAR